VPLLLRLLLLTCNFTATSLTDAYLPVVPLLLLLLVVLQPIELRESFLHDLNPESSGFPITLGELAERLKSWRNRLTTELEAAMPASLRLEEECRALQDIQLAEVELPGQYLAGHEVTPDSSIYLEAISSNVAIVRRSASSFRRLSLICSDGITRHMLVQVRVMMVAMSVF
jgi:hypothetical protein